MSVRVAHEILVVHNDVGQACEHPVKLAVEPGVPNDVSKKSAVLPPK